MERSETCLIGGAEFVIVVCQNTKIPQQMAGYAVSRGGSVEGCDVPDVSVVVDEAPLRAGLAALLDDYLTSIYIHQSKANDNKQKAREEINAFVQKQVEKGLAKASLSKKKRPVKPYDDKELDAMLAEYDYDDLENLVNKDEDDDENEAVDEDEISVDSEEASESS